MNNYIKTTKTEMKKQFKLMLSAKNAVILMTLLPILEFSILYGRYLPFKDEALTQTLKSQIGSSHYFSFFLIGYIGLMLFQSVILTAWFYSRERVMGTLEITYMTPASKLGLLTGSAIVGTVKNAWMSIIFAILMAIFIPTDLNFNVFNLILIIPLFIIPAICWGTFVNSLLMFSRNGNSIFTIFSNILSLLSGTEIPVTIFPYAMQIISFLIPLTWSLSIVRKITLQGALFSSLFGELLILTALCMILMISAYFICKKAEKHLKQTGNLTLF